MAAGQRGLRRRAAGVLAKVARRVAVRLEAVAEPAAPGPPADSTEPAEPFERPPAFGPDPGPPEHWLQLVKAKAPHLLDPRRGLQRAGPPPAVARAGRPPMHLSEAARPAVDTPRPRSAPSAPPPAAAAYPEAAGVPRAPGSEAAPHVSSEGAGPPSYGPVLAPSEPPRGSRGIQPVPAADGDPAYSAPERPAVNHPSWPAVDTASPPGLVQAGRPRSRAHEATPGRWSASEAPAASSSARAWSSSSADEPNLAAQDPWAGAPGAQAAGTVAVFEPSPPMAPEAGAAFDAPPRPAAPMAATWSTSPARTPTRAGDPSAPAPWPEPPAGAPRFGRPARDALRGELERRERLRREQRGE